MEKLTARSSTIFIATGDDMKVFRSVEEIPPELRRRLEETTSGSNAATILIADKRGREELVRAMRGLPTEIQSRLATSLRARENRLPAVATPPTRRWRCLRVWLEILAPVAVGVTVWFLTTAQ